MIIETPHFKIYFGDSQDAINKPIDCVASGKPLVEHAKFIPIAKQLSVNHLAFLNQTHSNHGATITDIIPAFTIDGDFLINTQPTIGIGVMTADCLPIVIYDSKNHVAAVVHAGWRGTVARIVQKTIDAMKSQKEDLHVYYGPSANSCCYQVNEEFKNNISAFWYADRVLKKVNDVVLFDLPLLNTLQLQEMGIHESAISREYNFCTICDHRFFSYRRQGESAGRQMTVISLK